jgi:PAS domain-containing protein
MSQSAKRSEDTKRSSTVLQFPHPTLQLIYDTAPIGLACLSPERRYSQINQRLTEICGISVEDHLGRFVRDCVHEMTEPPCSGEALRRLIAPSL